MVSQAKLALEQDPLLVVSKGRGGLQDTALHLAGALARNSQNARTGQTAKTRCSAAQESNTRAPRVPAASKGHVEILKLLLSHVARHLPLYEREVAYAHQQSAPWPRDRVFKVVVNQLNIKGQTPLMFACYAGQAECVRVLIEYGADPWWVGHTHTHTHTHTQKLDPAAGVHARLPHSRHACVCTPEACMETRKAASHTCAHAFVSDVYVCRVHDYAGRRTALHYAALHGHATCISAVLDNLHPDDLVRVPPRRRRVRSVHMLVNQGTSSGFTPLHFAVYSKVRRRAHACEIRGCSRHGARASCGRPHCRAASG